MWLFKKLPTVSPGKFLLSFDFLPFKSESFLTLSKFITSEYRWLNFLANKKTRNAESYSHFCPNNSLTLLNLSFLISNGCCEIYLHKVLRIKGNDVYTSSITVPWPQEVFGKE